MAEKSAEDITIELISTKRIRRNYIKKMVDRRTLLELMAEEAAELSQACLKSIRAEKLSHNPTPMKKEAALQNLQEELDDLMLVADLVGLRTWPYENTEKVKRWVYRLMEADAEEVAENELCKETEKSPG